MTKRVKNTCTVILETSGVTKRFFSLLAIKNPKLSALGLSYIALVLVLQFISSQKEEGRKKRKEGKEEGRKGKGRQERETNGRKEEVKEKAQTQLLLGQDCRLG